MKRRTPVSVHFSALLSEEEFNERLGREFQRRRRKLDAYEDFIRGLLTQEAQFLSSAQIHDRLKEQQ